MVVLHVLFADISTLFHRHCSLAQTVLGLDIPLNRRLRDEDQRILLRGEGFGAPHWFRDIRLDRRDGPIGIANLSSVVYVFPLLVTTRGEK